MVKKHTSRQEIWDNSDQRLSYYVQQLKEDIENESSPMDEIRNKVLKIQVAFITK